MKFLLLSALVAVTLSLKVEYFDNDITQWEIFKINHYKTYDSDKEEEERKTIFLNNLKFVKEHNAKFEHGEVTFNVSINKFGDLSTQEFAALMNGYKRPKGFLVNGAIMNNSKLSLPENVDWRIEGAVTGVKDQLQCGSCWAFSATGSLEGQHYLKSKQLVSLSEQNLIDCSTAEGNMGCNGGLMDYAFIYIMKNNGIDTEESYPYEGVQGPCRYNPNNNGATVTGYVDITSGYEIALENAVATIGPISVAIDAGHESFQFYNSGIYNEPACSSQELNHGVLAVGYGTDNTGGAYWLVKNSWGTGWGMSGYIMMARNNNNMCGIATMASYPTV